MMEEMLECVDDTLETLALDNTDLPLGMSTFISMLLLLKVIGVIRFLETMYLLILFQMLPYKMVVQEKEASSNYNSFHRY